MSKVLAGTPTHVTTPLSATVSAMANNGSGAVRVTTSAPHLFGDTDTVLMATTVSSANGTWVIAVIDASHFDLVGSTFAATGTGTVTDQSITPQVLCPTDGDALSAQLSGLISAFQACLDRTQYLQQQERNNTTASNRLTAAQVAQNWPQPSFGFSPTGVGAGFGGPQVVHWNDSAPGLGPSAQSWVMTGGQGSAQFTAFCGGMDQALTLVGGTFVPGGGVTNLPLATSLVNDTAGNLYMGHTANGGTQGGGIYKCPVGGSFATASVVTFGFTPPCTDVQLALLGSSNVIFAANSSTAASGKLGTVGGGVAVTGLPFATSSTPNLILKSNGTTAILTDRLVTNGTVYTTTTGTAWPNYSASSQFGTGVQILDFSWNAALSLWFALVTQGGATKIFQSLDALNWATVSSVGGIGANFSRIASFSTMIVAITSVTGVGRICYSVDGGVTWFQTGAIVQGGSGTTISAIKSSPTQLAMAAQEVSSNAVQPVRFSQFYGLPTGHL